MIVFALILLAAHLATLALATRRRPRAGLIGTPHITLLRPVCGLDPFDEMTLGSSFGLDYPSYDIIFCAGSADDPVVALVERLIAAHPEARARLMIGQDPHFANPKLGNVAKGWAETQADWICMTDANLLLPRDYLHQLVQAWGPRTGLVSAPPSAILPEGWAGRMEAVLLNGNQARLQLAADRLGFGFAQGKTLFFNKALMESLGGLPALDKMLAEDVACTRRVRAAGLQVSLTPETFAQPIGRRGWRQIWARQLRWSRVRREGFSALAFAELFNGAAVATALIGFGSGSALVTLAYLTLWYGAETLLMRGKGWPAGWRDAVLLPLRDLMLLALWIATPMGSGFDWRGTAMTARPV